MSREQLLLLWSLLGLLVGLFSISSGVYLAVRRTDRVKTDWFARVTGLSRAPRSYWMQCVAAGAFFTAVGLMVLLSRAYGSDSQGWVQLLMTGLVAVAAGAVISIIALSSTAKKGPGDIGR
jgi:hypothetical protein